MNRTDYILVSHVLLFKTNEKGQNSKKARGNKANVDEKTRKRC